ncbi:hypothetical protein [Chryseobacterium indologenes]|uniref:hypothetical protein n=1 Tax=Chryseobacterium indologenes TaxID=253 RepID=UPI001F4BB19D|nr:hypothetical protein [Chryseobacterium indologenes]
MKNSTIKPKMGQCIDCPPDTPEQRITANRCFIHYKVHRSKASILKNKGKAPKAKTPIRKVSKKREKESRQYTIKRLQFLAQPGNQRCFIEGCNNRADTIEHTAGRWGKNYLDESTWKPCCNFHNLELERNSELSEKYQLSKISGKQKIIKK